MKRIESAVRDFRREAALRSRAYRVRMTSEGDWPRTLLALGKAGPGGLFRVESPPRASSPVARFSNLSGRSIEIVSSPEVPVRGRPVPPAVLLRSLRGDPGSGSGAGVFVAVVRPRDEAASLRADAARLLGSLGGRVRSVRKARSSKTNGRRGGRPAR